MRLTTILFFFLIGNFSCKTTDKNPSGDGDMRSNEKEAILFLNFKVEQNDSENFKVTLIKNFWAPGSFKEIEHHLQLEDGIIEFQFLDKDQKLLKTMLTQNPLNASQEAYSPDGTIERKQLKLKQAELMVRVNVSKATGYVRVNDADGTITLIELL